MYDKMNMLILRPFKDYEVLVEYSPTETKDTVLIDIWLRKKDYGIIMHVVGIEEVDIENAYAIANLVSTQYEDYINEHIDEYEERFVFGE